MAGRSDLDRYWFSDEDLEAVEYLKNKFSTHEKTRTLKAYCDCLEANGIKPGQKIPPRLTLAETRTERGDACAYCGYQVYWAFQNPTQKRTSAKKVREVVSLRDEGWSWNRIAKKVELNETTVRDVYKAFKLAQAADGQGRSDATE